jgi:hypothetical protein
MVSLVCGCQFLNVRRAFLVFSCIISTVACVDFNERRTHFVCCGLLVDRHADQPKQVARLVPRGMVQVARLGAYRVREQKLEQEATHPLIGIEQTGSKQQWKRCKKTPETHVLRLKTGNHKQDLPLQL